MKYKISNAYAVINGEEIQVGSCIRAGRFARKPVYNRVCYQFRI